MSEQTIYDKSLVIRNETQEYANTRGRVADVLDDINSTKANKEDVDAAIQMILDEFDITEAELYAYIDARNSEQNLEIAKKINKPLWGGYAQQFIVVSAEPGSPSNLQPITLDSNRIPFWSNNTFFNSPFYVSSDFSKIGIGTSAPSQSLEVNGNVKAISYIFTIDVSAGTSGKMQYDGNFYYGTNSVGLKQRFAFAKANVFLYTPSANFSLSAVKTALEAQGMIFNDSHIIVNLGANNYSCNIDIGATNPNTLLTIGKRGNGSISFTSTRTLNSGVELITIMNGNEGSMTKLEFGGSVDFLTVRNL